MPQPPQDPPEPIAFPSALVARGGESLQALVDDYLAGLCAALERLSREDIARAADLLARATVQGRRVYVLGNGGSAATAAHMVNDLSKYAAPAEGPACRAFALTDNTPLLTAWSNDEGYAAALERQLAVHVEPGDVVLAISTSGRSTNVLRALAAAREAEALTIGLTGDEGGPLAELVDCCVRVPSADIGHQEDAHLIVNHAIARALRARLEEA